MYKSVESVESGAVASNEAKPLIREEASAEPEFSSKTLILGIATALAMLAFYAAGVYSAGGFNGSVTSAAVLQHEPRMGYVRGCPPAGTYCGKSVDECESFCCTQYAAPKPAQWGVGNLVCG